MGQLIPTNNQEQQTQLNNSTNQDQFSTRNFTCLSKFYRRISKLKGNRIVRTHIQLTPEAQQTIKQINARPEQAKPQNLDPQIIYFEQLQATYQGNIQKGLPHGQGIAHFKDGTLYQGTFKYGDANGMGIYVYADGSVYQGRFQNSVFHGYGALCYKKNRMRYIGDFVNGKPHGKGEQIYQNGQRYIGQFKNGIKEGKAIYKWPNGDIYEGGFKNGVFCGYGKLKNGDKIIYQGEYMNGMKNGEGTLYADDATYQGTFKNDFLEGKGKIIWKKGIIYSGNLVKTKMHGYGQIHYPNLSVSEAAWYYGMLKYSGEPTSSSIMTLNTNKNQTAIQTTFQQENKMSQMI